MEVIQCFDADSGKNYVKKIVFDFIPQTGKEL